MNFNYQKTFDFFSFSKKKKIGIPPGFKNVVNTENDRKIKMCVCREKAQNIRVHRGLAGF